MSGIELSLIGIAVLQFIISLCIMGNNSNRNKRLDKLESHLNLRRGDLSFSRYCMYPKPSRIEELEEKFNNLPENKAKKAQEKIQEAQKIIDSIGE